MIKTQLIVMKRSDLPVPHSISYLDRCSECGDEVWVSRSGVRATGVRKEEVAAICVDCLWGLKARLEEQGSSLTVSKLSPEQILEVRTFLRRQ
ncbi:MAG: hypothetical protein V3U90_06120 [Dehalococcoidia bacterium]